MRKYLAILITSLLCVTLPIHAWAATPKAGGKCLKAGQIATIPGIKFKCILVNKKLVWDKGTSTLPKQKPTTSTPTSDPYLISPPEIKSFQELASRYKDIKYWAWKKAVDAIKENQNPNYKVEVLVGPQSKECSAKASEAVLAMQNLYQGSRVATKSTLVYSVKEDDNWLKTTLGSRFPEWNPIQDPNGVNSSLEAYAVQTEPCTSTGLMTISGAEIAHGYTHALQKIQYVGSKENWGNIPRWLVEGGATFSENIIQYGQDYKTWITNPGFRNWDLKQYDLSFYRDFFEYKLQADGKYSWSHTDQWPNQRAYDVGSYACEVLVAFKGPASIINLHKEFAATGDFPGSFKSVFGIGWTEAAPILTEAVYKSTTWVVNSPDGIK